MGQKRGQAEQGQGQGQGSQGTQGSKIRRIYTSPLSRTLSTTYEVAKALGVTEVRVVYGLGECAAALRECAHYAAQSRHFPGDKAVANAYRTMLSFHSVEEMQALC